jgi:polyribonucleotide nucleotidyltransferase
MYILDRMNSALQGARGEVGQYAPRIETITIPTDKIRDVIGTGGKVIRQIVEETGAKIDVNDDGVIKVSSSDKAAIDAALKWIKGLTAEPEIGEIYEGKIVKVMDFGAFVNFFGPRDGLVHVSQLRKDRVNHPSDVVKEGDIVKVKLLGFDDRGKVRLSMRAVDQETGADLETADQKEEADA